MNSKLLLSVSSIFMGLIGIILTFLPQEVLGFLDFEVRDSLVLILQILGALYLGFALINWLVKGSLIGGIYNKPILLGNSTHFTISVITLVKYCLALKTVDIVMSILVIIYIIFAVSFAILLFSPPKELQKK